MHIIFFGGDFHIKLSLMAPTEMSCSSSSPGKWRKRNVPQSACGVVNGAAEPSRRGSCSLRSRQVRCQWGKRLCIVAGVVCKFDRHRFSWPLWNGSVQLLDCSLGFHALVKPDETHPFRQTWVRKKSLSCNSHLVEGSITWPISSWSYIIYFTIFHLP